MEIVVIIGFIALMAFCLGTVVFDQPIRTWLAKREIEQMTNANWRALGEERLTFKLNSALYDRDRKTSKTWWGRWTQQAEVNKAYWTLRAYQDARRKVEDKLREEKRERLTQVCQDLIDTAQGTYDSGTNSRWYGIPQTLRDAFNTIDDDHDLDAFREFRYVVGPDVAGHTIELRNETTNAKGDIAWQEFAWIVQAFGDRIEIDDTALAKALNGND